MVGDPNQAIYGFNGSSSEYMCVEFPKQFTAKKYVLTENYRSSRAILEAAKEIESDFEIEGQTPIQGEFFVKKFCSENDESMWIIEKLRSLLEKGHPNIEGEKIDIHQCAVLARNRYVFATLEKLLQENKIDYSLRVSINKGLISESNLFKIFDLGLRLLINNRDTLHFSELLSMINYNNQIIPEIVTFSELRYNSYLERQIGKPYSDVLNKVWDMLSNDTTSINFEQVLNCFKEYCENTSNFENDDERFLIYNDYQTWVERWKTYCKKTSIEKCTISDLMRSIALGITNISDDRGLILSTVHMAKGLEFDVVFIMGLNEGTFPDYRTLNNSILLQEERHNMFVSITRAKRLCYLSFPLEKVMPWGNIKTQVFSQFIKKEWILNGEADE